MEIHSRNTGTHALIPLLLFIIGSSASYLLFDNLKSRALESNIEVFDDYAQVITGAIETKIDRILTVMRGTSSFFRGNEETTEQSFRQYVRRVVFPHNEFKAISWVPLVKGEDREAFEGQARASGYLNYEIRERDRLDNLVPADDRALYYPIRYVEPILGNEQTIGYDLGSNLQRLEALKRLFETREPVATAAIDFLQLEADSTGILMLEPILSSDTEDQAEITGIIRAVIKISEIIDNQNASANDLRRRSNPDIYLIDISEANDPVLLYAGDPTKVNPFENPLQQLRRNNEYRSERAIRVADRDWLLFLAPRSAEDFVRTPIELSLILILGLAISTMISGYIYRLQYQKMSTEIEVQRKNILLDDRQKLFSSIVDTALDGIITMDEFGIIETYNKAAENIFGYSPDEIIGENIETLFGKKYGSFGGNFVKDYVATGKLPFIGAVTEVDGRRKDGSEFSMDLAASEVLGQNPRRFTGIVRDISAKKQVDKMKEEFISTVSHELRTPLTAIYGSIEIARSGQIKDENELNRILSLAARNSERLIQIVNDLLDMEKLQSFKAEFNNKSVLLNDIIENAVRLNQSYADTYGVKLDIVRIPKNAYVNGDQSRLTQVLTNLISNAVKYSPKNDTVSIMVTKKDDNFCVEVSDNGPGVPKSFIPRLFERFAQADSSDTRAKSGTGLGLAISKEIIKRHNGQIGYEPNNPRGAIFYFTLPVARSRED